MTALAPEPERITVFLPGHVVPEEVHGWGEVGIATAFPSATTIAELDMFVADNGSPLAGHFVQHCAANPDYQSCSSYVVLGFTGQPQWLCASITSALPLTQRPWYFAHAGSRIRWLHWLEKALQQQNLTLHDVEQDIREGAVRPSLLEDASKLAAGIAVTGWPDTTLDSLFVCPECRLSDAQYALLHSQELQERTLLNAKLSSARKAEASGNPAAAGSSAPARGWRRALQPARLYRHALHYTYLCYAATLRPLIRGSAGRRSKAP
jgi:hypothetical protein